VQPAGGAGAKRVTEGNPAVSRPPVDVTCTGPFRFDFVKRVASFDQNVQVRQLNPAGPGDRLDCDQLDVHFTPRPLEPGASPLNPSRRQQSELGRLEPSLVVAQGHPVIIQSPIREAEARSQKIQLHLGQRRVILDGGHETTLISGKNVLRAPSIDYWHPASDAGTKVGRFRASGPGSIFYIVNPDKPDEAFQAGWQTSVVLDRSNGQPILTLDGRPELSIANLGKIESDQLTVWFREMRSPSGDKIEIMPDRLSAQGAVEIDSSSISARTEELVATFELLPELLAPAVVPTDAAAASQPQGLLDAMKPGQPREPPKSTYHLTTDRLQLGVRMRGHEALPASVVCDGKVVLREIPLVRTAEQPIELRGEQLTATGIDVDAAQVKIVGPAATDEANTSLYSKGADLRSGWVQFSGRGMSFYSPVVEIDQRQNRMWSHGRGEATILITRDFAGRESTSPDRIEISWSEGMDFDGQSAQFRGAIEGRGADDSFRCRRLTATLASPIEFGGSIQESATDVAEIELAGEVMLEHRSRDQQGPTSHERFELVRLSVNQQTGVIDGDGPGVIRSTHFGKQLGALAGMTLAANQPPVESTASEASGSRLNFMRVDFAGKMTGNLITREVTFHRLVRVVHGPVDSWEQEFEFDRPESLPPKSFTLECDELWANEDPVAARSALASGQAKSGGLGPIQLLAIGNVRIAGESASGGRFFAQSTTASYDQGKELVTVKGEGRTPAVISVQQRPGEVMNPTYAESFRYSLDTGFPEIVGFQGADFSVPPARNQQAPPAWR
jgi:hypothetical protein